MKHFLKLMAKSNLWRSKNSNSKVERVREIHNNEFQQKVTFTLGKQSLKNSSRILNFVDHQYSVQAPINSYKRFWSHDFHAFDKRISSMILKKGFVDNFGWRISSIFFKILYWFLLTCGWSNICQINIKKE